MLRFPTAKTHIHFTLHVLGDLMAAVAEDQVTKTKLILYQSIADVVQLTLSIFPLFIHRPGRLKIKYRHVMCARVRTCEVHAKWCGPYSVS